MDTYRMDSLRVRYDSGRDYLVLPEDLGDRIAVFSGRKIIFNKSLWYGFRSLGYELRAEYGTYEGVIAVLVMSEHNRVHLELACPAVPVFVVRPSIDVDAFHAAPCISGSLSSPGYPKTRAPCWRSCTPSPQGLLRI